MNTRWQRWPEIYSLLSFLSVVNHRDNRKQIYVRTSFFLFLPFIPVFVLVMYVSIARGCGLVHTSNHLFIRGVNSSQRHDKDDDSKTNWDNWLFLNTAWHFCCKISSFKSLNKHIKQFGLKAQSFTRCTPAFCQTKHGASMCSITLRLPHIVYTVRPKLKSNSRQNAAFFVNIYESNVWLKA